jgi:hypothetical protein
LPWEYGRGRSVKGWVISSRMVSVRNKVQIQTNVNDPILVKCFLFFLLDQIISEPVLVHPVCVANIDYQRMKSLKA